MNEKLNSHGDIDGIIGMFKSYDRVVSVYNGLSISHKKAMKKEVEDAKNELERRFTAYIVAVARAVVKEGKPFQKKLDV